MKTFKKLYIEKYIQAISPMRDDDSWGNMVRKMLEDGCYSDGIADERNLICDAVNRFEDGGRQVFIFDNDALWEIANTEGSMTEDELVEFFPYECAYFMLEDTHMDGAIVFKDRDYGPTLRYKSVPKLEKAMSKPGTWWDKDGKAIDENGQRKKPYPPKFFYNLACYLSAINADLNLVYTPVEENNRSTKRERRRSAATITEVGFHIGSELREYKRRASSSQHLGGTVRPHMRRAHWHRFWTGPRDGERKLVLKWLAPIFVNPDSGDVGVTAHLVHGAEKGEL